MKPSIAAFLTAAGHTSFTPELIKQASDLLYGNIGAGLDQRDWDSILSSGNALEAARTALEQQYQDPDYLKENADHLRDQGYSAAQIEKTYRDVKAKLGVNHDTSWADGTVYQDAASKSDSELVSEAQADDAFNLSDSAANLAATATSVLNGATNITATDAATVAQAATIAGATNSGTTTYSISDTVAAVVGADAAVLNGATDITATGTATVAQGTTILAATNSGTTTYDLSDTAANLDGAAAATLNGAIDITATDAATVAQATTIAGATNSGTTTYSISDTVAAVVGADAAVLNGATTYDLSDTAANLDGAAAATLNGATDITATDAATVAEGTVIESATNSGSTTYDVSDTATAIAGSDADANYSGAGTITATTDATGAEASTIAGYTVPVVYSVSDTSANLVSSTGLNEAVNITSNTDATVSQAETIADAFNSGATTFDIADSLVKVIGDVSSGALADTIEEKNGMDEAGTITAELFYGSEVVIFDNTGADNAATSIDFSDGAASLLLSEFKKITGDSLATVSGDVISVLGSSADNTIDASGQAANFHIRALDGIDNITGGVNDDTIDVADGDNDPDTVNVGPDSMYGRDTIVNFNAGNDLISFNAAGAFVDQTGVDYTTGNADISQAITAVVFDNTNGDGSFDANDVIAFDYSGATYAIIDSGDGGWSASQDALVEITGYDGVLDVSNFIG